MQTLQNIASAKLICFTLNGNLILSVLKNLRVRNATDNTINSYLIKRYKSTNLFCYKNKLISATEIAHLAASKQINILHVMS